MTPKGHIDINWPLAILASKLEHSDTVLINLMHFLGPIASPSAQKASLPGPSTTKILYFTNRSSTPFMSAISRKIGEITLRDFKVLFDRPGFYRFHFKTVDEDYGMVKEEVIYLFVFKSVVGLLSVCFEGSKLKISQIFWLKLITPRRSYCI